MQCVEEAADALKNLTQNIYENIRVTRLFQEEINITEQCSMKFLEICRRTLLDLVRSHIENQKPDHATVWNRYTFLDYIRNAQGMEVMLRHHKDMLYPTNGKPAEVPKWDLSLLAFILTIPCRTSVNKAALDYVNELKTVRDIILGKRKIQMESLEHLVGQAPETLQAKIQEIIECDIRQMQRKPPPQNILKNWLMNDIKIDRHRCSKDNSELTERLQSLQGEFNKLTDAIRSSPQELHRLVIEIESTTYITVKPKNLPLNQHKELVGMMSPEAQTELLYTRLNEEIAPNRMESIGLGCIILEITCPTVKYLFEFWNQCLCGKILKVFDSIKGACREQLHCDSLEFEILLTEAEMERCFNSIEYSWNLEVEKLKKNGPYEQYSMLSTLTLRNFAHFQDEHTFAFNRGSYILSGENTSGKNCIFEAVRRCMSTSMNTSMLTCHDEAEHSYVICEYTTDNVTEKQGKVIYSCVVSFPRNEINVKIVVEKSTKHKIYVDLVKKNIHGCLVNMMFPISNIRESGLTEEFLGTRISTDSLRAFVLNGIIKTELYRSFVSETVDREYDTTTLCEMYLKQSIDKDIFITMPLRRWSNNPKFDNISRTIVNAVCQTRFSYDIITWYLDNPDISIAEQNTVDDLFTYLTLNRRLRFRKKEGVLQLLDSDRVLALEQPPEGILEAQICAILLSVKQFKTVCLEEIGKGMDPQMIERFRDFVLNKVKNKTVIMATDVPELLNTWKYEKLFFFRRDLDQDGRTLFKAIHGKDMLSKLFPRDSVNTSIVTIFFSSRVLFVQGFPETLFLSAVKSVLVDDRCLAEYVLESVDPDITVDTLYQFLCSLRILQMNGSRNRLQFENVCTALARERFFILDYDEILDIGESTRRFFLDFRLEHLKREFLCNGVAAFERDGIFVWANSLPGSGLEKGGTIENAVLELINKDGEELKFLFLHNKAVLNWGFERKSRRLFTNRDITDENINAVVRGVIQKSLYHTDSDMFRLIKFLVRAAKHAARKVSQL